MKKINFVYIFILAISCEKNEIPINRHPAGEVQISQINMGEDYSTQIFYNLSENSIVSNNLKANWDLGFNSSNNGTQIIINYSTFSQVSELKNHNFNDLVSASEISWQWNDPRGINHGDIFSLIPNTSTYILDRGYNIDGSSRGYKKIRVDSINNNSFFITHANLDNTNQNEIQIVRDTSINFTYFSFNNNNVVSIEPNKNIWDLAFTQYTHLFENNTETPAYLVTGVLTNYMNDVTVAKDTINSFAEINIDMINLYSFSSNQNSIGYDWKSFDLESMTYTVNTEKTYIIKGVSNRYFKLHFIDFYNEMGVKGYPKFEIQEL